MMAAPQWHAPLVERLDDADAARGLALSCPGGGTGALAALARTDLDVAEVMREVAARAGTAPLIRRLLEVGARAMAAQAEQVRAVVAAHDDGTGWAHQAAVDAVDEDHDDEADIEHQALVAGTTQEETTCPTDPTTTTTTETAAGGAPKRSSAAVGVTAAGDATAPPTTSPTTAVSAAARPTASAAARAAGTSAPAAAPSPSPSPAAAPSPSDPAEPAADADGDDAAGDDDPVVALEPARREAEAHGLVVFRSGDAPPVPAEPRVLVDGVPWHRVGYSALYGESTWRLVDDPGPPSERARLWDELVAEHVVTAMPEVPEEIGEEISRARLFEINVADALGMSADATHAELLQEIRRLVGLVDARDSGSGVY